MLQQEFQQQKSKHNKKQKKHWQEQNRAGTTSEGTQRSGNEQRKPSRIYTEGKIVEQMNNMCDNSGVQFRTTVSNRKDKLNRILQEVK